jgi:3-hydroxybenzoate/4-hydroxybenzoate---CoA ligase
MNAAEHVLARGLRVAGSEKLALESTDECLSYGALRARVAQFAAGLRAAGVGAGDRVAILMSDTPDLVALYLAVISAGGVSVALSLRAAPDELLHVLRVARPFAVATDEEFSSVVEGLADRAGLTTRLLLRRKHLAAWKACTAPPFSASARRPSDPAFWVVTSGSTGTPKIVEHRQDNVLCCTTYVEHALEASAVDRFFATSRLNFAYALGTVLFGSLTLGATTVLLERWPTADAVAGTIDRFRPSLVLSVPTLYHKLLELDLAQTPALRSVRHYVSAGERLAPAIAEAWAASTGRAILDGMGCSESVYMIMANTPAARRDGSSGRPVPGAQVRLANGTGIYRDGEACTGRLEARVPSLCSGYRTDEAPIDRPASRPEPPFCGEWFATGDEYMRDEDGFFHHCGRTDDLLKVAGVSMSPVEIEDTLVGTLSIAEAAAVSVEGRDGLLEIALFVVPAAAVDRETAISDARKRLSLRLPSFKLPRRYMAVAELPRTSTGKIQRHKLRAALR